MSTKLKLIHKAMEMVAEQAQAISYSLVEDKSPRAVELARLSAGIDVIIGMLQNELAANKDAMDPPKGVN